MTRQIFAYHTMSGSGHLAVLIILFGILISVSQPQNPKCFSHAKENIVAPSREVLNFLTCSMLSNSRGQTKKRASPSPTIHKAWNRLGIHPSLPRKIESHIHGKDKDSH